MKKFLIPLLAGFMSLVTACDFEDVFEQSNVFDIVTYTEGLLVNDYGNRYNVIASDLKTESWRQEGKRYYAVFDIKNRMLDITLRDLHEMQVYAPAPLDEDCYVSDPVIGQLGVLSGGYFNLILRSFRDKKSDYPHHLSFRYEQKEDILKLYVIYDGNGENPVEYEDKDQLETVTSYFSILLPTDENSQLSQLKVILTEFKQEADQSYSIQEKEYSYTLHRP